MIMNVEVRNITKPFGVKEVVVVIDQHDNAKLLLDKFVELLNIDQSKITAQLDSYQINCGTEHPGAFYHNVLLGLLDELKIPSYKIKSLTDAGMSKVADLPSEAEADGYKIQVNVDTIKISVPETLAANTIKDAVTQLLALPEIQSKLDDVKEDGREITFNIFGSTMLTEERQSLANMLLAKMLEHARSLDVKPPTNTIKKGLLKRLGLR